MKKLIVLFVLVLMSSVTVMAQLGIATIHMHLQHRSDEYIVYPLMPEVPNSDSISSAYLLDNHIYAKDSIFFGDHRSMIEARDDYWIYLSDSMTNFQCDIGDTLFIKRPEHTPCLDQGVTTTLTTWVKALHNTDVPSGVYVILDSSHQIISTGPDSIDTFLWGDQRGILFDAGMVLAGDSVRYDITLKVDTVGGIFEDYLFAVSSPADTGYWYVFENSPQQMHFVGCDALTTLQTIEIEEQKERVLLYPNPVAQGEMLNIKGWSAVSSQYDVYDAFGRLVLSGMLNGNQISVPNLPQGVYRMVLTNQEEQKLQVVPFVMN